MDVLTQGLSRYLGREELAKLGYEGPAIGKVLEQVLDAVIDGQVANEREALLAYLDNAISD